jgi:hypothetical protein
MALGRTTTMRFEGATWGELRALVRLADSLGMGDSAPVDFEYDDQVSPGPVGIEVFEHMD